ncbi:MAG: cytoplasmic protein [Anaerolineae bacterium]|jgi:predicted peroxiredoxin
MPERVVFVLFAGPEMPCKLQHALLFARDIARNGGEARIVFEGNAPRALVELQQGQSNVAGLFKMCLDEGLIAGVCKGCAMVHGAVHAAQELGLPLLDDAFGHVSLVPYIRAGMQVITL